MTAPDDAVSARDERLLVLAVACGSILIPLNSTMLVVAMPRLLRDLHASLSTGGWLVTGYLIAMASLQPVTGKIGDRIGPRPMVLLGLSLFAGASIGCALSPNIVVLLAFRVGQAVTGAMFLPNATGLLRRIVPVHRLGGRMGMVGATTTVGAAAGPVVGGILVGLGGWRSIFAVNLPLVAIILVLAWRALPHVAGRIVGTFDAVGAGSLLVLLTSAAFLLTRGKEIPTAIIGAAAGALVLFAVWFVRFEHRHDEPVVDPDLLRTPVFSLAVGGIGLSNLSMYVTLVALPVLLERRGWAPAGTGLVLSVLPLPSVFLAPIGGRLADRVGSRLPAFGGLLLMAAGLSLAGLTSRGAVIVAGLLVAGIGLGLSGSALQLAAISAVPAQTSGSAAGLISTGRYAGSIIGTSLLAGPLAPHGRHFGPVFVAVVMASLLATALAARLPGRPVATVAVS